MAEDDSSKQEEAEAKMTSPGSPESPEPVLSATTAIREDQVQNAVAFLSHPKVRGSTTESKKTFLQKKGLTEAEITDAFKRVPEASDTTVGNAVPTTSTPGQLAHITRPQKPFPTAAPASGHQQPAYPQSQALQPQQSLQPAGYRWSQVALGAGLVAVTAWGVKSLVYPYAVQVYRSWSGKPDPADLKQQRDLEMSKILSDAITAQSSAISAQTAELKAAVDSMKDMLQNFETQSDKPNKKEGVTLSEIRQELRSFAAGLHDFSSGAPASPKEAGADGVRKELAEIRSLIGTMAATNLPLLANGHRASTNAGDASSVSKQLPFGAGPQANHTAASSPVSFRSGSNSPQARRQLTSPFQTTVGSPDQGFGTSPGGSSGEPPHPKDYATIIDMLQKGEQVPGIEDIDDKPPNPDQAIAEGKMKPRPKPWERAAQKGGSAGHSSFFAGSTAGSIGDDRNAGSNNMPGVVPTTSTNGVEITEVANTPDQGNSPTAKADSAPWRPPPVPQSSINLKKYAMAHSEGETP